MREVKEIYIHKPGDMVQLTSEPKSHWSSEMLQYLDTWQEIERVEVRKYALTFWIKGINCIFIDEDIVDFVKEEDVHKNIWNRKKFEGQIKKELGL